MDECKHGMNPEWCAQCLGHLDAEEQENQQLIEMVRSLQGHNDKESE